jgi:hypothetical protein
MLPAPLALKRRQYPKKRYDALLALRTRDRGSLTRRGVVNLLAFALTGLCLHWETTARAGRGRRRLSLRALGMN